MEKKINNDGWTDTLSGLGTRKDKSQNTVFKAGRLLDHRVLSEIWRGDGYGKKIVETITEDMVRAGWEIVGDTDGKIEERMVELKIAETLKNAMNWNRLYGGAIVVLGVADGRDLDKPIGNGELRWVKTYASPQIEVLENDIVDDAGSPYFDGVEVFKIRRKRGGHLRVHASRCLVFQGDPLPFDYGSPHSLFFGMSELEAVYSYLSMFGGSVQNVAHAFREFFIGKYKVQDLAEILATNNSQALNARLNAIDASKSMVNAVFIGEGEEYTRESLNVSGMPELLDKLMMVLAGATIYPATKLFGRSAAGLNATGENDMRGYYDAVGAERKRLLEAPLKRIANAIARRDDLSVQFGSLWTPTQAEELEMKERQARIDQTYLDLGILTPEEVREARFVNGWSFNTSVDDERI